jgi:hypothetical protein
MRIVLLSALLATSVFAQHRGGGGGFSGRMHSGPYYPRPYYASPVAVPYAAPYSYGYAPAPSPYDYGYAAPAPPAYVNPDFQPDSVNPQIVDYSNVPLPEEGANTDENGLADDQPTIFLIALTDHTVLAAIAYWVDGDTLHWVSRDAKQNHLSLSLVDRDFSKQLNDQRHVEFKLPRTNE